MNTLTTRFTAAAGALVVTGTLGLAAAPAYAVDATFPPTAIADYYATGMDAPLTIDAASGLLSNDNSGGNAGLMVEAVTLSAGGTLSANADGSFVFTPDPGFTGTAHFIYNDIASGFVGNSADIFIDVTFTAKKLVGAPDFYTTLQDTPVEGVGGINDLIMNDPDTTYVGGIDDVTGEVTVNIYGQMLYTPAPGFVGTKTFSYYLSDGSNIDSDWILVTIEVTPITIIPSNPIPHDSTIPANPGDPGTADSDLPTLAYTGTDDVTTWLIAPALALVGFGVFAVWFARRRAALS